LKIQLRACFTLLHTRMLLKDFTLVTNSMATSLCLRYPTYVYNNDVYNLCILYL